MDNLIVTGIGLVICFGGIYIRKFVAGVMGLIWGALVGIMASLFMAITKGGFGYLLYNMQDDAGWLIIAVILALIICVLSILFDKLCTAINAFFSSFFIIFIIACIFAEDPDALPAILFIAFVAALAIARIAYLYYMYGFIIVTAFTGAYLASIGGAGMMTAVDLDYTLNELFVEENAQLSGVIFLSAIILGVFGCYVQLQKIRQDRSQSIVLDTGIKRNDDSETVVEIAEKNTEKRQEDVGRKNKVLFIAPVAAFLLFPIVRDFTWMLYYDFSFAYYLTIILPWIYSVCLGITLGIFVYIVVSKNVKYQMIYQSFYMIGFLIFNFQYLQYGNLRSNVVRILRFALIWAILYILSRVIRKEKLKPWLLIGAALIMWYIILDWIAYGFFNFYISVETILGIGTAIASVYYLFKKSSV